MCGSHVRRLRARIHIARRACVRLQSVCDDRGVGLRREQFQVAANELKQSHSNFVNKNSRNILFVLIILSHYDKV